MCCRNHSEQWSRRNQGEYPSSLVSSSFGWPPGRPRVSDVNRNRGSDDKLCQVNRRYPKTLGLRRLFPRSSHIGQDDGVTASDWPSIGVVGGDIVVPSVWKLDGVSPGLQLPDAAEV